MSTYGEKAERLFRSGYNCAQAVLLTFRDQTGLSDPAAARLASPFGAGMGQLREVCGAFSGALMALGACTGPSEPGDRDAKRRVYGEVQKLAEKFRSLHGSIICGELLGMRPGPNGEKLHKPPCSALVHSAADLVAEMLDLKA